MKAVRLGARARLGLPAALLCALVAMLAAAATASADVFGSISLVSSDPLEQADYAHDPAISENGQYVAFDGYIDGLTGVWRKDLQTGTIEPVAVGEQDTPAGDAELPSISENGQYISFTTTARLDPANDTNVGPDVYVRNMDVPESAPCEEASLHPAQPCAFTLVSAVSGSTGGLTYEYASAPGPQRETEEEDYGAMASGRSAITADGQSVVFVTTARSNLAGVGTPELEVAVRHLQTGVTEVVSVEYDPATGRPAVNPQTGRDNPAPFEKEGASTGYGPVYSTGTPPSFRTPQPYLLTQQVPASISADGTTVAWLGQDITQQAATLSDENLRPVYTEPLWRRIADGEGAPTRRVTGGSDPTAPACVASGQTSLPEQAPPSNPCQGPFSTTANFGVWTSGDAADPVPRLSRDGYTVAFLAQAPLATLGNDFGVDRTTRNSDLYVVNMHEGLTRDQAITQLTELASGDEQELATTASIIDFNVDAEGNQVAFTTKRTVFPLSSPAYVTAPSAVPGLLELFDVDLADDTLTRVSHGFDGEASEHPHRTEDKEDQYERPDDGALSPSFSGNGETIAFSSTASNLVFGDGNTPALGEERVDGSDVFTVNRVTFNPTPAQQSISPEPPNPTPTPTWALSATASSQANGTVELYVEVPGAGTLHAAASGSVRVSVAPSKRHGRRASRARTAVVTRRLATGTAASGSAEGGLMTLRLTLPSSYSALASRAGGLSATATVTFSAAGHASLSQSLAVTFVRTARPAHAAKAHTAKRARGSRRR